MIAAPSRNRLNCLKLGQRPSLFEPLESRLLLACDLLFQDGTLFITGDQANDHVMVVDHGNGLVDVTCGDGRIVRGEETHRFRGVREIVADLGEGDDVFVYRHVSGAPVALTIDMGDGNDRVHLSSAGVGGTSRAAAARFQPAPVVIAVDLGEGDNALGAQYALSGAAAVRASVNAGDGNNTIGLSFASASAGRGASAGITDGTSNTVVFTETTVGNGNNSISIRGNGIGNAGALVNAGDGTNAILIGLLLPAVQKVREAAAHVEVSAGDGGNRIAVRADGYNKASANITTGTGDDDVAVALLLPAVQKVRDAAARMESSSEDGDNRIRLSAAGFDQADAKITTGNGDDDAAVALLLPAVQEVREAAARMEVDLGEGNNRIRATATGFNDVETRIKTTKGDSDVSVALLLPAVQKVREAAARTGVVVGDGDNRVQVQVHGFDRAATDIIGGDGTNGILIGLLLPAVQKVREAAARTSVQLGDGDNRVAVRAEGYSNAATSITTGDGLDEILIGLLLPAVQKVREAAARLNVDTGDGDDRVRINIDGYSDINAELVAGRGDSSTRMECRNNLKQIGIAMHYGDGDNEFDLKVHQPAVPAQSSKPKEIVVVGSKVREAHIANTVGGGLSGDAVVLSMAGLKVDGSLRLSLNDGATRTGLVLADGSVRQATVRSDTVPVDQFSLNFTEIKLSGAEVNGHLGAQVTPGDGSVRPQPGLRARPPQPHMIGLQMDNVRVGRRAELDVQLRGGDGDDVIWAELDRVGGDGSVRLLADGGAGNDIIGVVARVAPMGAGSAALGVLGGDGNDTLLLAVFPARSADGSVRTLLNGGPGRNIGFATSNVMVRNIAQLHVVDDDIVLSEWIRRAMGQQFSQTTIARGR